MKTAMIWVTTIADLNKRSRVLSKQIEGIVEIPAFLINFPRAGGLPVKESFRGNLFQNHN